jgi:hypothetical protein
LGDHLPSEAEEFNWFFNKLLEDVAYALEVCSVLTSGPDDAKYLAQLLWALAVVAADRRPGAPANVDTFLQQLGLSTYIDSFLQESLAIP